MPALLLVGGGKMGGALLAGWLAKGDVAARDVCVVEPDTGAADRLREQHGVTVIGAADSLEASFAPAVTVFAVKPQVMCDVAPAYRGLVATGRVFLSIAAGKTIANFED